MFKSAGDPQSLRKSHLMTVSGHAGAPNDRKLEETPAPYRVHPMDPIEFRFGSNIGVAIDYTSNKATT